MFGLDVHKIPNAQKNRFVWLKTFNINTILDVGANEGQFSLEINKFLPQATIFAFEPLKETFCQLLKNTSHLNRFVAFNIALGDFNGHSEIYKSAFSPSSSLLEMEELHKDAFPYTTKSCKERIEIKKLDDLVKENNLNLVPEILIKLDVQGYEDKVINGGMEVFRKAKVIITEVSYHELYKEQCLFNEIYNKLTGMNFKYVGSFNELSHPKTGMPLSADAIFIKE